MVMNINLYEHVNLIFKEFFKKHSFRQFRLASGSAERDDYLVFHNGDYCITIFFDIRERLLSFSIIKLKSGEPTTEDFYSNAISLSSVLTEIGIVFYNKKIGNIDIDFDNYLGYMRDILETYYNKIFCVEIIDKVLGIEREALVSSNEDGVLALSLDELSEHINKHYESEE